MNTVLMKYMCGDEAFLIYDAGMNALAMDERMIRILCTRNFGLNVRGFIAGAANAQGYTDMKEYQPDGKQVEAEEGAKSAFLQYLSDEGRICEAAEGGADEEAEKVCRVGKIFVMDELISKITR